ncbi:MAG: hypothetical protein A3C80_01365 [Candidatus Ryanbacteria bacterium RIFCSPHIGHO2_02_FULL_45_43]|nr:MAG: hypothetical protein A2718_04180 [Candidatus Ryanbacteria bacterium RIFCSPHIGHO2_01_FULL_44_130]OGZ48904.1 MAG: hypothetical protein A3C80_01365 [Candidatus Ryanbacteria bacterium RIFCSPHIGHO2_02_FULL_45_43]OGZ50949.1 MAG: hypothetical protein A3E55_02900 [Candidatus Ryanbacteria bacterium RIFCSPHIGHO2_12_FULL_44_20]OGZ51773.1 MAG: hypothetical protein A3A17_02215 [Candidatus Ryanbacteria bacterium RIFCSPLOWO2_01_FULL_44_230]OGZ55032.1 MAG: hypothetical protein A3F85_03070 [Candidatus R
MKGENKLELAGPKPYEVVGIKFDVFGKVPKSWLSYGKYGFGMDWMDVNGNDLPMSGPSAEVVPGLLFKFKKKLRFYGHVDLSYFQTSEHPRGLVIEISGDNKHWFLLPLIIGGTNQIYDSEHEELRKKLSVTVKKVLKRKEDWKNYNKELSQIRKGIVFDIEILEGVFEILKNSEERFEEFSESEEDKQEKDLEEKYKDVIAWRGPLLRGIVGRMDGYEFRVYSGDHNPKHFHVIHKGRGIDARFSYPQIQLIDYKGSSSIIGSKESAKIREFFEVAKNLQKLNSEFQKQLS